jgi:hypothetical protein
MAICTAATGVLAEPMTLDAVLAPKQQVRLDFKHDDRHFLMFTEREGSATGSGVFSSAKVSEFGMHDVVRGEGGRATGYLEAIATNGDVAYFRWELRALFVAGSDGKSRVIDNGYWELAGGTGQFENMRGVGTLLLEFVSKTDRRFLLEGDLSPAP